MTLLFIERKGALLCFSGIANASLLAMMKYPHPGSSGELNTCYSAHFRNESVHLMLQ